MKRLVALLLTLMSLYLCAEEIIVTGSTNGTGNVTWTSDNTYVLNGFVFVNDGQTLNIEAGTVVKAMTGEGAEASALIVARGGKIYAEGTKDEPIIFTSIVDDLTTPLDLRGLWGGLLILGNGVINNSSGEEQIEGIPETEPRGKFGGSDDNDNSGVIKYVSIRYGGTEIGSGNEINGLSLGAVGSETVLEHIEIVWNKDDGIEFFGGKPNVKYLACAFCGDDAIDYDLSFRGNGQFWFALQGEGLGEGERAGEHDGGTDPEDGTPYAIPNISNVTYIGSGFGGVNEDNQTFIFRDNAGGHYMNSIFYDFVKRAIEIEDLASGHDSRERLETGDLTLVNNLWFNCGSNDVSEMCKNEYEQVLFTEAERHNSIVDPNFVSISRTSNQMLNPRPMNNRVYENVNIPTDSWFDQVDYCGAFNPSDEAELWLAGWSFLSQFGYLDETVGIDENLSPVSVDLLNCYPNPFNPETNITFTLSKNEQIKLAIFNERGELVTNLYSGNLNSGNHSFKFDATGLTSGTYFYQLKTANSTYNKKMVLIK